MSDLIEVSKYQPGMILVAPILNRYGQVLLAAGIELQPSHNKMFLTWGIKLITVKNSDADEGIVITDEMREKAEKIFSSRLNWIPKTGLEKDLFETGVKKILMNLSKRNNK